MFLLKRVKFHRRGDSPRPLEKEMLDEIVTKEMGNMLQRGYMRMIDIRILDSG